MRSPKIDLMYAATSSLAMKRPRRMSSDWSARENSRAVSVALVLVLRERLHHDLLELDRVAAHDRRRPRDVALLHLRERVEIAVHAEEALPRRELPEHDAEREDVGAAIELLARAPARATCTRACP